MKLKNAIEFLLYSYFGLKLEDGNDMDKVLEKSIGKAYSDATQQGAYNTLITKNCKAKKCMEKYECRECPKKKSDEAKKAATEEINKKIKSLLENGLVVFKTFNDWHKKICGELCEIYEKKGINTKEKKTFSYGNAQKWVNMSLKYLCIIYGIYKVYMSECKFCESYERYIAKYEKDFHVPVDSYIINAVKGKKCVDLPFEVPWSKWDKSEYENFQSSLLKYLEDSNFLTDEKSPLDWENEMWIKQKEER